MNDKTVVATIFHPEDLPTDLLQKLNNSPDHFCVQDQMIYLLVNGIIISCPDDVPGQEMISSVIQRNRHPGCAPETREDIFSAILNDPYYIPEEELLIKNRIAPSLQRCAVVFRAFSPQKTSLHSVFESFVPVEKGDTIISAGFQAVILIKAMQHSSIEELSEYSDAVIGSMETEGISGMKAGIGNTVTDITAIRSSYLNACSALSLGMKYHSHEHVFVYEKLTLDKIIDSIPQDLINHIRKHYFRTGSSGALSDEMMETVRVFFENDLNLTAASRQLFIHRNTLNYRLDKIKKDFGLDLRCFRDAVIFKILSEIPEE